MNRTLQFFSKALTPFKAIGHGFSWFFHNVFARVVLGKDAFNEAVKMNMEREMQEEVDAAKKQLNQEKESDQNQEKELIEPEIKEEPIEVRKLSVRKLSQKDISEMSLDDQKQALEITQKGLQQAAKQFIDLLPPKIEKKLGENEKDLAFLEGIKLKDGMESSLSNRMTKIHYDRMFDLIQNAHIKKDLKKELTDYLQSTQALLKQSRQLEKAIAGPIIKEPEISPEVETPALKKEDITLRSDSNLPFKNPYMDDIKSFDVSHFEDGQYTIYPYPPYEDENGVLQPGETPITIDRYQLIEAQSFGYNTVEEALEAGADIDKLPPRTFGVINGEASLTNPYLLRTEILVDAFRLKTEKIEHPERFNGEWLQGEYIIGAEQKVNMAMRQLPDNKIEVACQGESFEFTTKDMMDRKIIPPLQKFAENIWDKLCLDSEQARAYAATLDATTVAAANDANALNQEMAEDIETPPITLNSDLDDILTTEEYNEPETSQKDIEEVIEESRLKEEASQEEQEAQEAKKEEVELDV